MPEAALALAQLSKRQCRDLAQAELMSTLNRHTDLEIDGTLLDCPPSKVPLLMKLSTITWTSRRRYSDLHFASLISRVDLMIKGRPAPGDIKEKLVPLFKRAAAELPWPELPGGTELMFNHPLQALSFVARCGEPEAALEIFSGHVEDVERKVSACNIVAKIYIYRLHWLLSAAVKFDEDEGRRGAYVAEAKGMMGRATRSLRGLQQEDFIMPVSALDIALPCRPSAVVEGLSVSTLRLQVYESCQGILNSALRLHLSLELIALCRELIKVAPATFKAELYVKAAGALVALQKPHEAEELLHEGLAVCPPGGIWVARVSRRTRRHESRVQD
jgi:hypothetical protein